MGRATFVAGGQTRRDQLVDAAIRAIQREGAGASMDQMAAEAGVSKPILYRHFGDKGELYQAIAKRYVDRVAAELRAALDTDSEPRVLLGEGIDAFLALVEADPEIYRFLMQRARFEQSRAQATLDHFVRQLGQEIGVLLGERLAALGLDTGGAEVWGHGIVGMVNAAVDWWVERQVLSRRRLVAYLTDLLWAGLAGVPVARPNRRPAARRPGLTTAEGSAS